MAQIPHLIATLKKQLKAQGLTYQDVAAKLDLSEASVKRLFAENNFSLKRLEEICSLIHMEITELVQLMDEERNKIRQLSREQEENIVSDVLLLMITACVINGFSYQQILERYNIKPTDCIRKLAQLDRQKIIELLPNNRIKLLVSPDFNWIPNGPIQNFFQEKVEQEYFSSTFSKEHEKLLVLNGLMTKENNLEFQKKMEKLAKEFTDNCKSDIPKPFEKRLGNTTVLALRHWDFSVFKDYQKN